MSSQCRSINDGEDEREIEELIDRRNGEIEVNI